MSKKRRGKPNLSRPARVGTVGQGHGSRTPDLPQIRRLENEPDYLKMWKMTGMVESDLTLYQMGKVKIMIGTSPIHGYHLSISHPDRYPTWDEIAKIRYELVPNEVTMGMVLPPREDYINVHPNCFQLVEVRPR